MKIRAKLVLAFFLLAIVPLTGIVLYSYFSSIRAVRATVEREAQGLTADMEERRNIAIGVSASSTKGSISRVQVTNSSHSSAPVW